MKDRHAAHVPAGLPPWRTDGDSLSKHEKKLRGVGAACMACVLALALSGLLGRGPAAHARSGEPGGSRVEYDAYVRCDAPTRVRVLAPRAAEEAFSITLDRRYLDCFEVRAITPLPTRTAMSGETASLVFDRTPATRGAWVTLDLVVKKAGRIEGLVSVGDTPVRVSQWALP